jgi:hypothetical protein
MVLARFLFCADAAAEIKQHRLTNRYLQRLGILLSLIWGPGL